MSINITQAQGVASVILQVASTQVDVGEMFNVNVKIDPKGENLDTIRLGLDFPADLLEAQYVTLGSAFPNVSPGNNIDNNKGEIFYGGFRLGEDTDKTGVFATVVFKTKKPGTALIALNAKTKLIGAGEEKFDSNFTSISINIEGNTALPKESLDTVILDEREVLKIISETHPNGNQWYAQNTVKIEVKITGKEKIDSLYYIFDQNLEAVPKKVLNLNDPRVQFDNLTDGVWNFLLKVVLTDKETYDLRFPVLIDTLPPNKLQPLVEDVEIEKGQSTWLRFGTTDQTSGIDYYTVQLNDKDLGRQNSPLNLENLPVGDTEIIVTAYDKAQNSIAGKTFVRVREAEGVTDMAQTEDKGKSFFWWIFIPIAVIVAFILLFKTKKLK